MENKVSLNVSPFGVKSTCRCLDFQRFEVEFPNQDGTKRLLLRWDLYLESPFGNVVSSVYSPRDFVFEKGKFYELTLTKFEHKRGSMPSFIFSL